MRSGVFKGRENDAQDPGTYVVEDMREALELICEKERVVGVL